MISKELLSEVLGYEADPSLAIEVKGEGIFSPGINIHEIAHKCKEWALKNGYWIDSNLGFVSIGKNGSAKKVKSFNGYDIKLNEPGLILKSCEWIENEIM